MRFVTDDIDEAVFMASRVVVMSVAPGPRPMRHSERAPLRRPPGYRQSTLPMRLTAAAIPLASVSQ